MFIDIPSMSECHDNHQKNVVDHRVNDSIVTHLNSIPGSATQGAG
jgi:hypothetical protein